MKITQIELFKVRPRWLFVKISTDEGISGWGEPVLEGRADACRAAVEEMKPFLVGEDPRCIEKHFQRLYRGGFYRGGGIQMSAISGVEQALWDIKGRYHGMPVHQFLGGPARDRIKVYGWIGGDERDADRAVQDARLRLKQGFRALKMTVIGRCPRIGAYPDIDQAVEQLAAVRSEVGPGIDIAVDFHGRVHKSMAKVLVKALEEFSPLFYEEPVLPEHNDFLGELSRHTAIPIATGERVFTRWGFKDLIAQGVVDIIQPDLSHAGGILETRKIAAMAEAYDIAVAPHCPLGPLATASALHLDTCTPNAVIQETSLLMQYNQDVDLLDYVKNKDMFAVRDGYMAVPTGDGLGVEVDEEKVREADREGHDWQPPQWTHDDGGVAEW